MKGNSSLSHFLVFTMTSWYRKLHYCVILIIFCPNLVFSAEQVVLLDTTQESSLAWHQYPQGPNAKTPGWIEESFTNFDKGINWRSYVVCDVQYDFINNWLWTPFIERGPANRIYIEIQFSMRDCNLFPGTALSCKETFSLLYYEFDAVTAEPPPLWEQESYTLIDRIAADEGRFTLNNEVIINTEVRSIPATKKGVYFAFRDQGACISLLAIKVYYITCPEVTASFSLFPSTPTGRELTSIEQAEGKCVNDAVEISPPRHLCKGDGKWYLLSGGCQCKPGFEADHGAQTCNVCPPGRYKHELGDGRCISCPEHSTAPYSGSPECRCNNGYYRAEIDPKVSPCTKPPSAPQNLTLNFVDQSTVMLSWSLPKFLGGRQDTVFRVTCDACSYGVTYNPNTERFNATRIHISALNPVSHYHFKVFAENGVTSQAGEPEYVELSVKTEASSNVQASISNVRVESTTATEISLMWEAPDDPFSDLETFEVRYFMKGQEANASSIKTGRNTKYKFQNLMQKTEYGFKVRAKLGAGWGEYSPVVYKKTGQLLTLVGEEDYSRQGLLITIVAAAVALLLVFLCLAAALFFRGRGSDECNKKQPSDCDTLEYRNNEGLVVTYNFLSPAGSPATFPSYNAAILKMTTPLFIGTGSRSYIDPHTYEDPHQAIREFAREIDASCISIEAIIGGGEFGDVCKGKLRLAGRTEIDVAIKTLKPGSSDKCKIDFLTEASIMGQFEHCHVIFLQGVVTKSNPVMIITEYMENGSLDTFLRANDGKFQVVQLVGMLRGIAAGMQYLSEMNYVHRDLAARNVLVNSSLICKIADFGLSREIESSTEDYTTRGGKIPVRWTAPEAIAFRKFTSASDVWSWGIVCWEVMSYGERPYWNWSNQDVIKSIEKGYRLPPPMDCPESIYQLMLDCWHKERSNRPTFAGIVATLDSLIRLPDSLAKIAPNRVNEEILLFETVEEWLEAIKMGRYIELFRKSGVTSMDAVVRLTVHDLAAIGVTLVGHQRKIINSIQTIRTHLSHGFLV